MLLLFEFGYFLLVHKLCLFEYLFEAFVLPVLNFAFDHRPLAPGLLLGELHFARVPLEPVDVGLYEFLVFELLLDEFEYFSISFAVIVLVKHLHGLYELVLALAFGPVLHSLRNLFPLDGRGVYFAELIRTDNFHKLHHAVQNHVLGVISAFSSEFFSVVGI